MEKIKLKPANKQSCRDEVLELLIKSIDFDVNSLRFLNSNHINLKFEFSSISKVKTLQEGASFLKNIQQMIKKQGVQFDQIDISLDNQIFMLQYIDLLIMNFGETQKKTHKLKLSLSNFNDTDKYDLGRTLKFLTHSHRIFQKKSLNELDLTLKNIEYIDMYTLGKDFISKNSGLAENIKFLTLNIDCVNYSEQKNTALNCQENNFTNTLIEALFELKQLEELDLSVKIHPEKDEEALVIQEKELFFENLKKLKFHVTLPSILNDQREENGLDTSFPLYLLGEMVYYGSKASDIEIRASNVLLEDLEIHIFKAFMNMKQIPSLQSLKVQFDLFAHDSNVKPHFTENVVIEALFPYRSQFLTNFSFCITNGFIQVLLEELDFSFLNSYKYMTGFNMVPQLKQSEEVIMKVRKNLVYQMYLFKRLQKENNVLMMKLFNRLDKLYEFSDFLKQRKQVQQLKNDYANQQIREINQNANKTKTLFV